ncbi:MULTISPECIES: WxL domain-containing protein [Peribacillus]|uniref:Cell surface protein n=1 Tax=Peribacillus simplex TaxID=1478 RepID=A0AAN2TQD4_9BACI|nr:MULTISPECIES: WxL domain-containing protein [Peribacillus]MEA3575842.1 WxL domain-containing protein [Peribacillus frigoritolerans]CEG25108.1 cell surface protein [Peribacillus simplex]
MKKRLKVLTGSALATSLILGGAISAFAADGGEYNSSGTVKFKPYTGITEPVDPNDPDKEVKPENPDGTDPNPGTNGPLSIDFASSLDFGENEISNVDQVYYAAPQKVNITDDQGAVTQENRANYVQISDNRGSNAGWTLKVKQEGQFENDATLNPVLTGSQIKFVDGVPVTNMENVTAPTASDITLDPSGAESLVMTAAENTGAGKWLDVFGTVVNVGGEPKNAAITLSVPGSTPKDAVEYSTKLTWVLTDSPTNNDSPTHN